MKELVSVVYRRLQTFWKWPTATVEYPYVSKSPPLKARAGLRVNFADCIGSLSCAEACPVDCISIETEEFPDPDKIPKTSKGILFERKVTSFKIDYSRCVLCGICIKACPTDAILENKNFPAPRYQMRHLTLDLQHMPRTLRREQGYEE